MKNVYMFITHVHKDTSMTGNVVETATFYDKMPKANIIAQASMIFDLFNGKVTKNRFSDECEDPFQDYVSKYREEIGQYLGAWGMQSKEHQNRLKEVFGGEQTDE